MKKHIGSVVLGIVVTLTLLLSGCAPQVTQKVSPSGAFLSPVEKSIQNLPALEARDAAASQWESPIQEYIRNLPALEARDAAASQWESPIQEYIQNTAE